MNVVVYSVLKLANVYKLHHHALSIPSPPLPQSSALHYPQTIICHQTKIPHEKKNQHNTNQKNPTNQLANQPTMKSTIIVTMAAALFATTITATPTPEALAAAEPRWRWSFCRWGGQGCSTKLKRTVEAANEHMHDPAQPIDDFLSYYCSATGTHCRVAKRFAEALAEAHAVADPEPWRWSFCRWGGQGCSTKMKRAADEVVGAFSDATAFPGGDDLDEGASDAQKAYAEKFKEVAERLHQAALEYQQESQ